MAICRCELECIVHACHQKIQSLFPALEIDVPELVLDRNLNCDALSESGRIYLHPNIAITKDNAYVAVTIAHEIAHQWWGNYYAQKLSFVDGIAEYIALRVVGEFLGEETQNRLLRMARGRLLYLNKKHCGDYIFDAVFLGRLPLAFLGISQAFPTQFDELLQELCGIETDESFINHLKEIKSPTARSLISWLEDPISLPEPGIVDGILKDMSGRYLPAWVYTETKAQRNRHWLTESVLLCESTLISPIQYAPTIIGDIGADYKLFQTYRQMSRARAENVNFNLNLHDKV